MLKSMTAYGRVVHNCPLGRFVVEIQTLNRKHLDLLIQLPKELAKFETSIRQWLSQRIHRGKVRLTIEASFEDKLPISIKPNLALARQMKAAWDAITTDLRLEKGFNLNLLARETDILIMEDETTDDESYKEVLKQIVTQALDHLDAMKADEGKAIEQDFRQRMSKIANWINQIQEFTTDQVKAFKEKLRKTIEEVLPGAIENEERILREISVYAEKVDIAEEITRFRSHIDQFIHLLHEGDGNHGKKLDFLLQELLREVNTIGAKSAGLETSRLVVDIKTEIEKIREQVQNIE